MKLDRQTDRQTDKQTHTHTKIQTDRQTDRQTDTERQTDREVSLRFDTWWLFVNVMTTAPNLVGINLVFSNVPVYVLLNKKESEEELLHVQDIQ